MFSQPISVLIIDDDRQDRLTLIHYLSRHNEQNYQIFEASSGKKALETLTTVKVDGVILDFHLSDMNGIEFLQKLQNHFFYSNFAVIILTEFGNESVAMEAIKNGAQDYLIKENLTQESLQKSLYLAVGRVKLRRELEKSEQKFRGTFEQAAVGIYHINLVGQFVRLNQKFSQITGYFSEEIKQKTIEEIIFYEDFPKYQRQIQRLLNHETQTLRLEQRLLRGDGLIIWINITVSIINKKDGSPDYLLGIVEEIQERKQTEIKLKKANHKLKQIVGQLAKQNQERTLLSRVSQFLQSCNSIEEAYKILADLIQPLFSDCSLGIYQLNEQQTFATLVSSSGDFLNSKKEFRFSECWALRQGKAHYNDINHSQLFCPHVETNLMTRATLCYPIVAQGKTLGILHISATDQTKLTPQTENLAKTVSDYLTLSLANLKLRQDLKNQSIRDSLTGLYNRRHLYEFLDKEISKAQRHKSNIGIILIDIDHFKKINDIAIDRLVRTHKLYFKGTGNREQGTEKCPNSFGDCYNYNHGFGDVVLRDMGEFLSNNIRESDIACRYGGEEFILIFPHANLENTHKRAEVLRKKIKRLHFRFQQHHLDSVTVSIGVANFPRHGLTGEDAIHYADLALFEAKKQGRDRTVIYTEELSDNSKD
ncbi:diguanylate cyclase [Crocosphaera sp.]|uniref:diguanylate cyclase n=1 Tax=Crocosphaera sp. TaxID=2729996 RepID=UPI0026020A77|nr:diguanylate cyclase [Crocosphaera sp.]MDJ0578992.1 diguanylate cyclase [Crocosphaera sp.]